MPDQPPTHPLQRHIQGLGEFAYTYTKSALREPTKEKAVKLIRKLQSITESEHKKILEMAAQEADLHIACCAGCSYCCYQIVALSPPEAVTLGEYIRANYSQEEVDSFVEACRHYKEALFKTPEGHRPKVPCVFLLSNGFCGIHPARPLVCHAFNSLDVNLCIEQYEHPETNVMTSGIDPMWESGNFIRDNMRAAFHEHRLDANLLILPLAMEIVLGDPAAADKFIAGEDVFRPARMYNDDPVLQDLFTRAARGAIKVAEERMKEHNPEGI